VRDERESRHVFFSANDKDKAAALSNDSRRNARIVKCRNQQESEKIARSLNAAAKFRSVKLLSD
jgi:hypothetical protein